MTPAVWGPMIRRGSRGPQRSDPEPFWMPTRTIAHDQECSFCGRTIRRAHPGNTTGTRGTKAYYNAMLREWECIDCRQEALRAHAAALEAAPLTATGRGQTVLL